MIDATLDGHIARITLNRPDSHNALDRAAMADMQAVLEGWAADSAIRVLILTGNGRSFCAGVSLGDLSSGDWTENPLTALCDTLEAFPAPTICTLNGGVYGGGVELAMACDFRIGVEGMQALVPPARLGIHYEPAGIARVMQRLGAQKARRMFLLAETFDADALLHAGFLDRLVPPKGLATETDGMAETLSALAPMSVRGMKRTILEISAGTLDADAAQARIAACFASQDHREGLAAMREKRPPKFEGI